MLWFSHANGTPTANPTAPDRPAQIHNSSAVSPRTTKVTVDTQVDNIHAMPLLMGHACLVQTISAHRGLKSVIKCD